MTRLPLLLLLVGLAGCEGFDRAITGNPPAQGPVPDVQVVADSATYAGIVGDALREELASPIPTLPNRQGSFKLNRLDPASRLADRVRNLRLVVYAAPLDEASRVGEILRANISESGQAAIRAGRGDGILFKPDLWASGQMVVFMTAASDTALARAILRRGPALRDSFNAVAREATAADIFGRYRQTDIEDRMLDRLGVGVSVQYDFVVAQDTALVADGRRGRVMRLRRVLTDTWRDYFLFVQDGVAEIPPPDAIDRLTDSVLRQIALGSIDGSYVQTDPERPIARDTVRIGGRPARETRGLWYMTNDLMGGSYVRYATVAGGKLVVFYGMTFAPDRALDKREFLRQLEATAYTLRTREEALAARADD